MAKAIIVLTLEERDGKQIIHAAHRDGLLIKSTQYQLEKFKGGTRAIEHLTLIDQSEKIIGDLLSTMHCKGVI